MFRLAYLYVCVLIFLREGNKHIVVVINKCDRTADETNILLANLEAVNIVVPRPKNNQNRENRDIPSTLQKILNSRMRGVEHLKKKGV